MGVKTLDREILWQRVRKVVAGVSGDLLHVEEATEIRYLWSSNGVYLDVRLRIRWHSQMGAYMQNQHRGSFAWTGRVGNSRRYMSVLAEGGLAFLFRDVRSWWRRA